MNLHTLTKKQQDILRLLYCYRFLERKHIQQFLKHKEKRRIAAWLKDLKDNQYIDWIYDPDHPINKNKPATYYLSLHGIQFLRRVGTYPTTELRKRYTESARGHVFVERCLLLAECCLNMDARNAANDGVFYS